MEDDMNVWNEAPALDGSAGLTEQAALAAGTVKGFADHELHAGFISKQNGLPHFDAAAHVERFRETGGNGSSPSIPCPLESAVEDVSGEVYGGSGGTEGTAAAAGTAHGYVDHELHAGFVTKQTPL